MTDFIVPKVSMAMEDAVVSHWLVASGDVVTKGQEILVIETDKSTLEIESPASGVITLVARENDIVKVDGLLARISDGNSESQEINEAAVVASAPASAAIVVASALSPSVQAGRVIASPAARALARDLGVSLDSIEGSGPGGRIVEHDVRAAAATGASSRSSDTSGTSSLRAAVVANLTASWAQIPHINIGGRVPADPLRTAHQLFREHSAFRVTMSDLLITVVARALTKVPELVGSSIDTSRSHDGVNLALAIATPDGVVAPVIYDAHSIGILGIAAKRRDLVEAAIAGTLTSRQLSGANCTLSNLGGYPVDFFTPVITGPQICLVAVGRIAPEVGFTEGMLRLRHRIWMNAAIDHRMADGEAGGRFLAAVAVEIDDLPNRVNQELGMEST